jgi:hypothetical protein
MMEQWMWTAPFMGGGLGVGLGGMVDGLSLRKDKPLAGECAFVMDRYEVLLCMWRCILLE